MPRDANEIYRRYLDAVGLQGLASAEAVGLHTTDWYALSTLDLAGPLTSGQLAERTGLSTGATTRLIDRLERRGHVRRATDPTDRRRVIVERIANPDVDGAVGPARLAVGEVLARYNPAQLEILFDYFRDAAPAFRQAADEIRTLRLRKPTSRR